jgi:hypothetical protein
LRVPAAVEVIPSWKFAVVDRTLGFEQFTGGGEAAIPTRGTPYLRLMFASLSSPVRLAAGI